MSFPTSDDEGIDCFVLALVELSRREDDSVESSCVLSSNDVQIAGWVVNHTTQNVSFCRRSAPNKGLREQRSNTPWSNTSRQMTRNRVDFVEFKHHSFPGKYIDEYRNGKAFRQDTAYKDLLNRSYKGRILSENFVDRGKSHDHSKIMVASRHAPSVVSMKEAQTIKDENNCDKSLVVSSKGFSKLANSPLSGQFQGKKLQWRPTINNRKVTHTKATQWSKTNSTDVTLGITSQGRDEVNNKSVEYLPEGKPSSNLIVKRADLTSSSSGLRSEYKTLSMDCQSISVQYSPLEKCEAWVKNRNNELGTVPSSKVKKKCIAKGRIFRTAYHTPQHTSSQLALRGSALASPQKDMCSARAQESHSSLGSPVRSSAMDYSKYTDMFKNVLEFYGTRRLRPKSHSTVEELLSMKT